MAAAICVRIEEVAAEDSEAGAIGGDFFRGASEGGDFVALVECEGKKEATDASGRSEYGESHLLDLL